MKKKVSKIIVFFLHCFSGGCCPRCSNHLVVVVVVVVVVVFVNVLLLLGFMSIPYLSQIIDAAQQMIVISVLLCVPRFQREICVYVHLCLFPRISLVS